MSQIGNEKGGLEMIGRLLGGVDGKVGRVAAKLGSGASQDFARLMASAQGRVEGSQRAPGVSGDVARDGSGLSDSLRSALSALGEEITHLRQQLGSDKSGQLPPGSGGESDARAVLGQMLETIPASGGEESAGLGRHEVDMSVSRGGDFAWASSDGRSVEGQSIGALEATGHVDGAASGETAARSLSAQSLATDEAIARDVAGLAQALADWREALDAGSPVRAEAAIQTLRDRLAALRESMPGGEGASADRTPALVGQLQALQQLMTRSGMAGSTEGPVARGAGEPRSWSEWSWRLAAGGQSAGSRSEMAARASATVASSGEGSDWNGGPVTAALGLAGREMPAPSRTERLTPAHWSALGGLSAQPADTAVETTVAPGGLGSAGTAFSSTSAGQAAGGVFTGQAATPPPNPQMPAQLGQQIQWMVGKGVSRANIELRPADLGPLKISIETQGDETRIALTATNATTQGLLEQQLPRLKEWLQESGLAQSEVDVSLAEEGDFGQQLADADGGESDGHGGAPADAEMMMSASGSADTDDALEWVEGRGVLDLFA
ncbi:flagellar hook-length control protein FliK [Guyparkeria hydrothermalis]|uniref:flagellar hook-length control protein FliK n=1 Tax=Guyparkeria hydrothermalis TaxID=923 RepID=UPI00202139AD|nr:flagellar hook-length control protein FliK [Guyparkeria hydrothermalis]MCL7744523.1 flagellar hook-length control protein FliK [Guyparkeria hydrothermalis]